MKKIILTIAAILAVSSAVLSAGESGKPSAGAGAAKSKAGKKAPEFKLKNYDGKMVSLSDYKGKIVVLEWYNYECPFVKHHYEKLNTMVNLADKYKAKNVVWLAINSTSHLTTEKN